MYQEFLYNTNNFKHPAMSYIVLLLFFYEVDMKLNKKKIIFLTVLSNP